MQTPYYEVVLLDRWVQHVDSDGQEIFAFESAVDYPDTSILKFDVTGSVLTDPNMLAVCHRTKDLAHVNAIEADTKYQVLSSEEIVEHEAV